jgi:hypothetical protein
MSTVEAPLDVEALEAEPPAPVAAQALVRRTRAIDGQRAGARVRSGERSSI